ncbi:hypothetical protein EYF80_036022 [Liparis tanakae]|uniref:Uncharacterized protein n=1 Tax=Liparis tanakae TaxID=230148 RepID=A0A4Z2GKG9_9TELE|nr:hypothetical protein EYF80_036022 [Liparis tanakae]
MRVGPSLAREDVSQEDVMIIRRISPSSVDVGRDGHEHPSLNLSRMKRDDTLDRETTDRGRRGVGKLNGPDSSIGLVMGYNWRINGASRREMERRRKEMLVKSASN